MATTPEATKGVPRHEGNSVFTPRADHNALADWVLDNTNKTVTTPLGLPATGNWLGRRITSVSDGAEWRWDGSGWILAVLPATSFTPAWVNLAVGAGTNTGTYSVSNGVCDVEFVTTLGAGFTIGAAAFDPPITPLFLAGSIPVGRATIIDSGTGNFRGDLIWDGARFAIQYTPGGAAFWSPISSTAPFTFASGDSIRGRARFSVA